ncbi:glycosyltransferase family 9 protein [Brachyspira hampsonii]|uniref:ADP-heptose--LPS heptosyltransferase II n=1 Tax=Brachyspira hampsonii TaxID=1287055 RepID=A0AAC9XLN5_9SPIR|nr:glycosyltransferase family 9 protein [Brachyspira hampsonii]ASJ22199.1 ADP-heptose--LPS heptosyltransferase II [Brachyspira hampsonii]ELV07013.1 ADP-heptose:LPS heptosyltransferase II [Brachyspira hampsonii 30599]MBW5379477.1 glycosyltransferase family 9 protein [Brachyspira hampsonii]MBW5409701.1 glycosyltransferase family 9 protein [Brachyspira hampsonii]OEJ19101.1 ADP-heptose--LPS heptosyltransferase [Brachyspira hampsonii]
MTKILIIGMNYIGDTIFITPLIRALKKHYNDCSIDVVNGIRGIDILRENPCINNIIIGDDKVSEYISNQNYDIGISATTAFYGASLLYKAKIPIRAGVNSECRGFLLNKKTSWKKHKRHIVDTILSILKPMNIEDDGINTEIFLSEKENEFGISKMGNYKNALLVHGGATRISKRYGIDNFSKLIDLFYKEKQVPIILIGSKDDLDFSNEMNKRLGNIIADDFTNKLSIRELISVIKHSYALIGGDSAPLHIANACNIYSIGIFGDTLPLIYGARGEKAFNIEARKKYCTALKSFRCEYIKRGCKTIDCLKKLEAEEILPVLLSVYKDI